MFVYLQQTLILVLLVMKQVADSLRFWLFSKGFPATEICGDRTQQVIAFITILVIVELVLQ